MGKWYIIDKDGKEHEIKIPDRRTDLQKRQDAIIEKLYAIEDFTYRYIAPIFYYVGGPLLALYLWLWFMSAVLAQMP